MSRSLWIRVVLLVAVADLGVFLPNLCTAQSSTTVSVATLRVPDKAWRHFDRAKAAAARNQVAESERESLKAIELAPAFSQAYLLLACAQLQEHKYDAALSNIATARSFDPGARWLAILQAGAYNGMGLYVDAESLLAETHGVDADSWQAAYERARAEVGQGNEQEALQWSEVALNGAPQRFADAHLVRANALLLARRWSDAIAQMNAYLGSQEPQLHRSQVLTALAAARSHLREEATSTLAAR